MLSFFKKLIFPTSDEVELDLGEDQKLGDAEVDLVSLRAFSVERDINSRYQTIIGYFSPDNTAKEWMLYLSDENHDKLVNRFRKLKGIT